MMDVRKKFLFSSVKYTKYVLIHVLIILWLYTRLLSFIGLSNSTNSQFKPIICISTTWVPLKSQKLWSRVVSFWVIISIHMPPIISIDPNCFIDIKMISTLLFEDNEYVMYAVIWMHIFKLSKNSLQLEDIVFQFSIL